MSRGHLSRSLIAETAISLIDQEGLDKLSMRRLGRALEVEAMSLYNHVKNKSDLFDAVHETLLSPFEVPQTEDWRQAVRQTCRSFMSLLRAHPGCIPLMASRSATTPGSLKVLEQCVGLLMKAGFSPAESLMAFQSLFSLLLGHAIFHYQRRDPESFANPELYQDYPILSQVAPSLQLPPEEELEFALEVLIDGLEGRLSDGPGGR